MIVMQWQLIYKKQNNCNCVTTQQMSLDSLSISILSHIHHTSQSVSSTNIPLDTSLSRQSVTLVLTTLTQLSVNTKMRTKFTTLLATQKAYVYHDVMAYQ